MRYVKTLLLVALGLLLVGCDAMYVDECAHRLSRLDCEFKWWAKVLILFTVTLPWSGPALIVVLGFICSFFIDPNDVDDDDWDDDWRDRD